MSFCSLRNGTANPLTLPAPYGGILIPGQGIVIPDSAANVTAALGSPIGAGIQITALPDDFVGATAAAAYLGGVSRERLGTFTRENVAISLTDSALQTALDGGATFTSQLSPKAGSIVGLWAILSANVTAGALTVSASVAGLTVAASATPIAIGTAQAVATFLRNAIPFAAGDKLGVMITTTAGLLPAATADLICGLIIES